jgi:hypothetical protein
VLRLVKDQSITTTKKVYYDMKHGTNVAKPVMTFDVPQ